MLTSLIAVTIAGVATAFTPSNFEPFSSQNLTVAFGSTPALNGVVVAKALTASQPTLGTVEKLAGSYTIMMVDPDVPSGPGSQTSELLHWLQPGMVSAPGTTTIAGQSVYELVNPSNTSAIASYIQPSPPQKNPLSHRYVQMLLNTTDATSQATLAKLGASRSMFNASSVVSHAGLNVLFANSFNVTFNDGNATSTSTSASGTATASASSSTVPFTGVASSLKTSVAMLGAVFVGVAVFL